MTALGLLLLLAACGKSAQVPLQSWLLDAMEGPTPVSALIHAATMVTAGVYLIVRSNFIFDYAPDAQTAVVVVAVRHAALGRDHRLREGRHQEGAGRLDDEPDRLHDARPPASASPATPFAIFHLLNHGFFKADMFLGAGSVMHGMDDDVDMRHYGALRKVMPVTFLTFTMGYLAIIGVPRLLRLLVQGQDHRGRARPRTGSSACCAMLGAGITGFYMTRLMLMTFFTEKRWADERPPARVAEGDDDPADRARRAVGARRRDAASTTGSSTSSSR